MCLPDFERFEQISEENAVTGYRNWNNPIKGLDLVSLNIDYIWLPKLTSHEVRDIDSGIYSYNHYNNNNYNNNNYNYYYNNHYNHYNHYNYRYNNYNYYYNNNNHYNHYNYRYNLAGVIKQFGKVAIHKTGYRSEFAKIETLFTIRESDAKGNDKFINWVVEFNKHVREIADKYKANTIHWQDLKEMSDSNSANQHKGE